MEDFKGTKGRWEVKHSQSKTAYNVVGTVLGCKYKIARCPYVKSLIKADEQEAKANAQLMATSPELLEDLQEAIELFDSAYKCMADGDNEGLYNALANATSRTRFKETIAKALGKEEPA